MRELTRCGRAKTTLAPRLERLIRLALPMLGGRRIPGDLLEPAAVLSVLHQAADPRFELLERTARLIPQATSLAEVSAHGTCQAKLPHAGQLPSLDAVG